MQTANEQKIARTNGLVMVLEGSFFNLALSFISTATVIPLFVSTLMSDPRWVGLAVSVTTFSFPAGQLIIGPFFQRLRNLPRFMQWIMTTCRTLPFMLMVPLLFLNVTPIVTMIAFLLLLLIAFTSDGLITLPWLDVFSRTIPANRRGRIFGLQQVFGGLASLAGGVLVKSILDNTTLPFATQYGILFGCTGLSMLISAIPMMFLKDNGLRPNADKQPVGVMLRNYFSSLPAVLRVDAAYRRLMMIRMCSGLLTMCLPFIILLGRDHLGIPAHQVTTLIFLQIVGSLGGGLIWGQVSARWGNKYLILLAHCVGAVLCLLSFAALWTPIAPIFMLAPMVVGSGLVNGVWMGFTNYTIDIAPEAERPKYLVINGMVTLPMSLFGYLAGLFIEVWGYGALFAISLCASLVAIWMSLPLKSLKQLQDEGHIR